MAAKKSATKKTTGSGTTSAATRTRKAAAPKEAKAPAPEASTKAKPAAKAAKKPLKLTEAQEKALRQIDAAGEAGYNPAQKTELRSIEKLRELKLVKKGAKDKATGNIPYLTTAAGKKHLASSQPSA